MSIVALILSFIIKMSNWTKRWFFVDESGDAYIHHSEKDWYIPYLMIWAVEIKSPRYVRKRIAELSASILNDSYFDNIPSINKRRDNFFFHAKDDIPELRQMFFKLLKEIDFVAYVCREDKIHQATSQTQHNFYTSVVKSSFRMIDGLENSKNMIIFEQRGTKQISHALYDAVCETTTMRDETSILIQGKDGEPCLQVADYITWAVQRWLHKGEKRYYDYLMDKIVLQKKPS